MFQTFGQMMAADPYRLAADAFLSIFQTGPTAPRSHLQGVLQSWCAEKAPTFLGLPTRTMPVLVACQTRCLLIWERSLAAGTYLTGSDHTSERLILLEPRLLSMPAPDLAQHFKLG